MPLVTLLNDRNTEMTQDERWSARYNEVMFFLWRIIEIRQSIGLRSMIC